MRPAASIAEAGARAAASPPSSDLANMASRRSIRASASRGNLLTPREGRCLEFTEDDLARTPGVAASVSDGEPFCAVELSAEAFTPRRALLGGLAAGPPRPHRRRAAAGGARPAGGGR